MDLSDELLFESKTARDQGLVQLKLQYSEERLLNKAKTLLFAVWNGLGRITRQQLADFYEVSKEVIDKNYQRHKDEFDIDGVEVLRGKDLNDARDILSLASKSSQETIYTAAAALRMGFILRDSQVAKTVRTLVIRFIQDIGKEIPVEVLLQALVVSNPLLSNFTEGQRLKISAPLAIYWDKMKSTLSKNYPNGGIQDLSKNDVRKSIQFLSTYTDYLKLQGVKELPYQLAFTTRAKYPELTSDIFSFQTDSGIKKSVFMFQFDELIIDVDYVESCIGRGYLQIAKESWSVDNAYLFFVAPFGATSYAVDHIRNRLVSDYQGCVGVLTVKDLATYLYAQAFGSRKLGTVKGEINSAFKELLIYPFPELPLIGDQLNLF
jgi:hypothetical protein